MNKSNKTILVTGSGTGIGQAVARKFAKLGYNIIILGEERTSNRCVKYSKTNNYG